MPKVVSLQDILKICFLASAVVFIEDKPTRNVIIMHIIPSAKTFWHISWEHDLNVLNSLPFAILVISRKWLSNHYKENIQITHIRLMVKPNKTTVKSYFIINSKQIVLRTLKIGKYRAGTGLRQSVSSKVIRQFRFFKHNLHILFCCRCDVVGPTHNVPGLSNNASHVFLLSRLITDILTGH